MLFNSKCLAAALLCCKIIFFFNIQVSGHKPTFPGFFTPPGFPLPPTPEFPLPPLPLLPPLPGFLTPPIPGLPRLSTPPPGRETCPKNKLTMKIVCANVIDLPILPVSRQSNPPSSPCCKYIEGLLDFEVAACFCSAVTFDTSDPGTNIPASLVSVLKYCQKELTHDFRCATASSTVSQ